MATGTNLMSDFLNNNQSPLSKSAIDLAINCYNRTFNRFEITEDITIRHKDDGLKNATIADFDIVEFIANGSGGLIYSADYTNHDGSKINVVLKISCANLARLGGYYLQLKAFNSNIEGSNRIMPIYDIFESRTDAINRRELLKYHGKELYVIVMPMGCMDLFDNALNGLSDKLVYKYILQMCEAISCCHNNNIMHRDIKLDNFIVMTDGNLRLIDFDFADSASENSIFTQLAGTPDFLSPEIIDCQNSGVGYTRSTDLWSLGVSIYDIFIGNLPFSDYNSTTDQTYKNILQFETFNIKHLEKIPDQFQSIIKLLLTKPDARPNINKILQIVKLHTAQF